MFPDPEQTKFCNLLYPTTKGFSTMLPAPAEMAKRTSFDVEGLRIGDLVLLQGMGSILYLGMNVTLPASDPRNNRIPKDFEPIELISGEDYTFNPSRFPPASIWGATNSASSPFETRFLEPDSPLGPRKVQFSSHATEGAFWALPYGGSSYECTPSGFQKLSSHALEHGRSWYAHYLRTAAHCASGVYVSGTSTAHFVKNMVIPCEPPPLKPDVTFIEDLESTTPMLTDSGYHTSDPDNTLDQSSCIAFRGIHMSLAPRVYNPLYGARGTIRKLSLKLPKRLRSNGKSWRIPVEWTPPIQPCAIINELIHSSARKVKLALVTDADIVSVLQEDDITMIDDKELVLRITAKFFVEIDDHGHGLLRLKESKELGTFEAISNSRLMRLLRGPRFLVVRRRP